MGIAKEVKTKDFQKERDVAYPTWQEQLDLLYHDMTAGKGDKTGEWYKAIKKIKDDIPDPLNNLNYFNVRHYAKEYIMFLSCCIR